MNNLSASFKHHEQTTTTTRTSVRLNIFHIISRSDLLHLSPNCTQKCQTSKCILKMCSRAAGLLDVANLICFRSFVRSFVGDKSVHVAGAWSERKFDSNQSPWTGHNSGYATWADTNPFGECTPHRCDLWAKRMQWAESVCVCAANWLIDEATAATTDVEINNK